MPTPQNNRMQLDWAKSRECLKALRFHRCEFMVRKSRGGIACEIGGAQQRCEQRPPRGLRGPAGPRDDAPSRASARQARLVWRAPKGPEGTGGLRGAAPNEVRTPSLAGGRVIPSAARLEAAARPAGPGCGARGRWRGLAGLRDDAPSEARGADGSRAGRRPRAHQAARPQHNARAAAGDQAATRSNRRIQTKSSGPQENLGTTTHAFTDVN